MSPRSWEVSVWPSDIKGLGGFRGWRRLSFHGHIKQDSLSVGHLWRHARQTFLYIAHTHKLSSWVPSSLLQFLSLLTPCASVTLTLSMYKQLEEQRYALVQPESCTVHPCRHISLQHYCSDNIYLSAGVSAQLLKNGSRCQTICQCELQRSHEVCGTWKMLFVSHQGSLLLLTLFQSERIMLYRERQNHIFTPLAMVPNYARTQSSFWKVYVWLCHSAGALFAGCFQNHFSTLQLNVISAIAIRMSTKTNQRQVYSSKMKTWKWNYTKWACFFFL